MANNKLNTKVVKHGKKLIFRVVPPNGIDSGIAQSMGQIDDLVTVDVYEGYRKLGRFRLSDAKLKFR